MSTKKKNAEFLAVTLLMVAVVAFVFAAFTVFALERAYIVTDPIMAVLVGMTVGGLVPMAVNSHPTLILLGITFGGFSGMLTFQGALGPLLDSGMTLFGMLMN